MGYEPTEKEMITVAGLDGPKRYEYTIKKVADFEEVWSLADDDGWCLSADPQGRETIPVWPAASYAQACCVDEWAGYKPKRIDIDTWIERWLPGMTRDGRNVAVFPTSKGQAVVIEPRRFKNDLEEELEKY